MNEKEIKIGKFPLVLSALGIIKIILSVVFSFVGYGTKIHEAFAELIIFTDGMTFYILQPLLIFAVTMIWCRIRSKKGTESKSDFRLSLICTAIWCLGICSSYLLVSKCF